MDATKLITDLETTLSEIEHNLLEIQNISGEVTEKFEAPTHQMLAKISLLADNALEQLKTIPG
jgi:hypothetical protein